MSNPHAVNYSPHQSAYPGYGATEPAPRSNPLAGVLLVIGALVGFAGCLIPNSNDELPIVAAFDLFSQVDAAGSESWRLILVAVSAIALMVGSLLALTAGFMMFSARRHGGAATTGLLGALLMVACPVLMLIATKGHLFDGEISVRLILTLAAWLPAMIGAFVGFRK